MKREPKVYSLQFPLHATQGIPNWTANDQIIGIIPEYGLRCPCQQRRPQMNPRLDRMSVCRLRLPA